MEDFGGKTLVIHKAISNNLIAELELFLSKYEKTLTKIVEEYSAYENIIKKSTDLNLIYENSKKMDKMKESLIFHLVIKKRILRIIEKNKKRIEFFNAKISEDKIPTFDYNAKQIAKFVADQKIELSNENISLKSSDEKEFDLMYFSGKLLRLKNGELDLRLKNNYNILYYMEDKEFNMIIHRFPNILNTITPSQLMDTRFKFRVFESIIGLVEQLLKTKTPFEVNEILGNPLLIKKDSQIDIQKFIIELDNLLNVKVMKYLIEKNPNEKDFISEKLKCDLDSEFLPDEYRGSEDIDEALNQLIELDLAAILNDLE